MTRPIHSFIVEFEIDSPAQIPRHQHEWIKLMIDNIRDHGYLPVVDHDRVVSTERNESGTFTHTIEIDAMFCGKRKAWEYEGLTEDGTLVTQMDKSDQS